MSFAWSTRGLRLRSILSVAAVVLLLAGGASAANLSAANYRIRAAQMALDDRQLDVVEDKLKEAEKFIEDATPEEKAPFIAQIKELRDKLASTPNPAHDRLLRAAQGLLTQAKTAHASGMANDAKDKLEEAERILEPVPAAKKADVLAQIKELRDKPAPTKAEQPAPAAAAAEKPVEADYVRREIDGYLGIADQTRSPDTATEYVDRAADELDSDKAKGLDAKTRQELQAKIAHFRATIAASQKKGALEAADGQLKPLEEQLAADPFKGLDQGRIIGVRDRLSIFVKRAHTALDGQPKDDPDVKARNDKLAALEAKLNASVGKLNRDQDLAELGTRWRFYMQDAAGWEQETPAAPSGGELKPWRMGKTVAALTSSIYWLGLTETKDLLDQYKDDPGAKTIRAEAEKTRDTAAAKLSAAFNQSLEDAEKRPLPRGHDLAVPGEMAHEADNLFKSTTYKDANVARATKLDQKWKEQLAAVQKEAAGALTQMTADANAAWPKIAGAIKAEDDFKPADAAAYKGRTIKLKAVRNRSGWDFDGKYDIALWIGDAPLAGRYESKVAKAMADAVQRIHQDVDDHIDWEVIAVVEGPGKINRRIHTNVIDAKTRETIAKFESYEPVDCIVIRVIALHAGPVAVGP